MPLYQADDEVDADEPVTGEGDDAEDSEKEDASDPASGPVAEGRLDDNDMELAKLLNEGLAETYYSGPSPRSMTRWRRMGGKW